MRTVVLRVAALALLLLLALFSVLSIRTMQRLPNTLLYFIEESEAGFQLAPAGRITQTDSEEKRLRAVLAALVRGPNDRERGKGFRSAFPGTTEILGISLEGTAVTVNLSADFATGDTAAQQARLYQLYYTLTQSKTIDTVYLQLDGEKVQRLGSAQLEQPWQRPVGELPIW